MWPWESLARDRRSTAAGGNVVLDWRCASSKPKEGEHVYLMRTGVAPKGIVAHGIVLKAPYEAPNIDPLRAQSGETDSFIDVQFDGVRDADRDAIVPLDELKRTSPVQEWNPQASGIEINPVAAAVAGTLWKRLPPVQKEPLEGEHAPPAMSRARNLILFGPPGTGKTYRLLKSYLPAYTEAPAAEQRPDDAEAQTTRRYEFVTFHQSYAYEDFVEGIRPRVRSDGSVTYDVTPGVFRRLCERAKKDTSHRYAIFIDEINRGNVAKIFGELITLLELDKRATYNAAGGLISGLEATMPHSGDQFGVPANLDVFATMNTADRSISLLGARTAARGPDLGA